MHQPRKWWVGLLALAPLWAVATGVKTGPVEADVTAKARAALARMPVDVIDEPQVTVAGRDVTLAGYAFNPQSPLNAAKAIDNSWGVRLVETNLSALPTAKPYAFSARTNANQIVLEGNAPLQSVRTKLSAAARAAAPGLTVVDGMKNAAGAPGGYEAQEIGRAHV